MTVAASLSRNLARRGHDVHFIGHRSGTPYLAEDGVSEHVIDPSTCAATDPPMHDLALAAKIAAVAEEAKLDLIHVHAAIPHAVAASLALRILGQGPPRLVTTLHGVELTLVATDLCLAGLARNGLDSSDAVTCVSESLKREIVQEFGPRKLHVIPDFLDTAPRTFKVGSTDRPAVLHISNFRPGKRIDVVLQAFARVFREVPCDLLLVGDGPERASARELARTLHVEGSVRFLSGVESYEALPEADVFLLPSDNESFGFAALAAMAAGIPVVGSDAGGLPEVVKHAECGYLLPVGDVEGLAERCCEILRDKERRREMGEAARHRARSRFGAERVVGEFEALYASLV
jgi:N-acetyl-alpha-D-glucosaminyl L-malate synthase BshA